MASKDPNLDIKFASDDDFLKQMIKHQVTGIAMSKEILKTTKSSKVKKQATAIAKRNAADLEVLRGLITKDNADAADAVRKVLGLS